MQHFDRPFIGGLDRLVTLNRERGAIQLTGRDTPFNRMLKSQCCAA
jgi:hypothetical protein